MLEVLRRTTNLLAPLLAVLALALWGSDEVRFVHRDPISDQRAQEARWADEVIAPQLADLGCDTVPRLSPKVAVRPAQSSPAEQARGLFVFDKGVVSVVSFDAAFKAAEAGDVWVVGWCG